LYFWPRERTRGTMIWSKRSARVVVVSEERKEGGKGEAHLQQ
jgi:hypothetical protein